MLRRGGNLTVSLELVNRIKDTVIRYCLSATGVALYGQRKYFFLHKYLCLYNTMQYNMMKKYLV